MKKKKGIAFPIAFATSYLFIYCFLLSFNLNIPLALLLFSFSPVVIIWMVVRILKDGTPSEKTFDEYFYEDVNEKRI